LEASSMPRKSSAALATPAVDGLPRPLEPPSTLSQPEAQLFRDLIAACDRRHFRPSDLPLLCRYVEAAVLAEQAAKELREHGAVVDGKASAWLVVQEKSVRTLTALSLRLRLSPQARLSNRSVGRQKPVGPHPWA
jgi:phage terminase small subunit